jgi:hypothetical protein
VPSYSGKGYFMRQPTKRGTIDRNASNSACGHEGWAIRTRDSTIGYDFFPSLSLRRKQLLHNATNICSAHEKKKGEMRETSPLDRGFEAIHYSKSRGVWQQLCALVCASFEQLPSARTILYVCAYVGATVRASAPSAIWH